MKLLDYLLGITSMLFFLALPSLALAQVSSDVAGSVWQDDNGDGIRDGNEAGLGSINVFLFDGVSGLQVLQTDNDGNYLFEDVLTTPPPFGVFFLGVAPADGGIPELIDLWFGLGNLPTGWIPTADPDGVVISPYEAVVVVPDGGLVDQDFGFQPATRIVTRKLTDPLRGNSFVTITSGPDAGSRFPAYVAAFTPPLTNGGSLLNTELAAADPLLACGPVADLAGKIAVIARGQCAFTDKVMNAKAAGAAGVVVFNVTGQEGLIIMGGNPVEGLPAVFVGNADGQELLLATGETGSLTPDDLSFGFMSTFGPFNLVPGFEFTSDDVGPGNQFVKEEPEDGWLLSTASCVVSDGNASEVSPDSIMLADGELAICTFLNVADTDNDGVEDTADQCADTMIPENVPTMKLKPNRWALTDGDFDFDTVTKGKGPVRSFTTTDTAGCSCEQIIEAQGLGEGHSKHGCSIGILDNWVEQTAP